MVKNSPANAGDMGSIPGLGRSCGEGNGNPLQYSCLGNLMDRGAWQATVHGVTKSRTGLNDFHIHIQSLNSTVKDTSQLKRERQKIDQCLLRAKADGRDREATDSIITSPPTLLLY